MRQLMDAFSLVYSSAIEIGAPMAGEAVGRVLASRHPRWLEGDLAAGPAGWQEHALVNGDALTPAGSLQSPSQALGVLGMPAFTAYVGLLDIGRPRVGETLVVAAATGAVGAVAGQIGKLKRSEEHTSELQSLMRISYAVFCLKKKKTINQNNKTIRI